MANLGELVDTYDKSYIGDPNTYTQLPHRLAGVTKLSGVPQKMQVVIYAANVNEIIYSGYSDVNGLFNITGISPSYNTFSVISSDINNQYNSVIQSNIEMVI